MAHTALDHRTGGSGGSGADGAAVTVAPCKAVPSALQLRKAGYIFFSNFVDAIWLNKKIVFMTFCPIYLVLNTVSLHFRPKYILSFEDLSVMKLSEPF